jgi:hypothetical protein
MLRQSMSISCYENPQTGCAGIETFANGRAVGEGREKYVADPLTCTPPRKIRPGFAV